MTYKIASGFSLVGTLTTCLRIGERLRIGFKFSRLVSTAIMNSKLVPYFAVNKLNVSATWSNSSCFPVDFGPLY